MSKEKTKKIEWGGARAGAGRPKGTGTKTKICVSVTAQHWQSALSRWGGKGSNLIDLLLSRFVENEVSL